MNVRFKSVLITGSMAVNDAWSRVYYDLNSVRSHECDVGIVANPLFYLRAPFHSIGCFIPLACVAVAGAFGCVIAGWAKADDLVLPQTIGIAAAVVAVPAVLFGAWSARDSLVQAAMEQTAREGRGLSETDRLKVVGEDEWDQFVAKLSER